MRFSYRRVSWAPLTWLAVCRRGSDDIEIQHGDKVETTPQWFCEAVWPGPFERGDFDLTDLVAGTGARLREGKAIFVSSGNTVDRIISLETQTGLYVSNSLPCLLALTGARIDPTYPRYYDDFCSIVKGIANYKTSLSTSLGEARFCMHGFLAWDGQVRRCEVKPLTFRNLQTYSDYMRFIRTALE